MLCYPKREQIILIYFLIEIVHNINKYSRLSAKVLKNISSFKMKQKIDFSSYELYVFLLSCIKVTKVKIFLFRSKVNNQKVLKILKNVYLISWTFRHFNFKSSWFLFFSFPRWGKILLRGLFIMTPLLKYSRSCVIFFHA